MTVLLPKWLPHTLVRIGTGEGVISLTLLLGRGMNIPLAASDPLVEPGLTARRGIPALTLLPGLPIAGHR